MTEPSLEKRLSSAGEALRSLKNPCPIHKSPMVVQRPPSSDIKLTKNSEYIEIVIPPQGIGFGLIALLSAAVPASIFSLKWNSFFTNNLGINPQFIMLISGSILGAVGVMFLFALFRKLRLRIDRHKISFFSHLLGGKWNYCKPAPRQEICQLEIEQIEYTIPVTEEKLCRYCVVIVIAGNQKYRLGEKQRLSESEIEWLATELSQWLGLKIKRTLKDGEMIIW
ncbi:hypothetical protein [Microcoleus vaginatus]|uniref:hypothetical protein n=1 Tax=Microcoleus vaginatus TaxID=119532 RepID=UPI001F61DF62|nr:hypothetical protein D0A37_11040 [Microcoleus vaginatus HSN003]